MAEAPSSESKSQTAETPAPEVLKPREESVDKPVDGAAGAGAKTPSPKTPPRQHHTYRPSHKGTFIGLAVVIAILAINAAIIGFVLKSQSKSKAQANLGAVTISQGALDKLGVNQSSVGDLGVQLVVNPNAKFNGTVTVGGDTSIGGQLKLNSKFTATDATLAQLEAGKTALQTLNVNGDTTVSNLNLRNDLLVTGTSRLQGPTVMSQLLTVNNNANISGSLSVGGSLSVNNFHASSMTIDSSLTVGGHVITGGSAPGVSKYSIAAFGSNGTVSISGNDQAGTVGINIGAGTSGGGCLAHVSFVHSYATTPHVIITPMGDVGGSYVRNKTSSGFDVCADGPFSPGGYTFDYIVEQ